jgi:uncharacterized protein
VHPEAYPLVQRILDDIRAASLRELMGDAKRLRALQAEKYVDDRFGLPTVRDILRELEKPGRDPRPAFTMASFKEGVEDIKDLQPGMRLEGVVTNVANFGAFVDIGVHQDGLVHVSALADRFVKDPREVVKAGDVVQVRVLEVDLPRKRIALTMRMNDTPGEKVGVGETAERRAAEKSGTGNRTSGKRPASHQKSSAATANVGNSAMADAFARLKR